MNKMKEGTLKKYLEERPTIRLLIDSKKYIVKELEVPKVQYSRRKYNQMDYTEQAEYEAKMKETKKEYRIYNSETTFFKI